MNDNEVYLYVTVSTPSHIYRHMSTQQRAHRYAVLDQRLHEKADAEGWELLELPRHIGEATRDPDGTTQNRATSEARARPKRTGTP